MQIKTNGVTRIVILCGGHAYKFPHLLNGWGMFLTGLLCNMHERLWAEFSPKLCPVSWAIPGGWLVVQRRARPLTDEEWSGMDPEAFCQEGETPLPVEPKRCSFGVLDGKIVAVDYG